MDKYNLYEILCAEQSLYKYPVVVMSYSIVTHLILAHQYFTAE